MRLSLVPTFVILLSGCAALDDTSYMPGEGQLRWQNPNLVSCPTGKVVSCDADGGRVKKTYRNCGCVSAKFR